MGGKLKKRISYIVVISMLITMIPFGLNVFAASKMNFKDGLFRIEAEDVTVNESFTVITSSDLSKGKGLTTKKNGQEQPDKTANGDIEFSFVANSVAKYYLWVSVNPTTANKNIWLSMKGSDYLNVSLGKNASMLSWVKLGETEAAKSGEEILIKIKSRLGYFTMDQFLVTSDGAYAPTPIATSSPAKETTIKATKLPTDSYPAPSFTPPSEHPRLYFMKKDIPRILENAKKPQNIVAWETHQKALLNNTDGKLPEGSANSDSGILAVIESRAFDYALNGNTENGKSAITAIHNYISTVKYASGDYNNTGQTIFTIAAVYDWCYNLLTDKDKEIFAIAVEDTAKKMEMGWPPKGQGAVTGHGVEGQLQRDLMSAAIAMYDERSDMYQYIAGRFFKEFVPAKLYMYPAHSHNQGDNYFGYRVQWEMLATLIFDAMGLPQVYGPEQQYMFYWLLYARRPDGQIFRDGDTSKDTFAFGSGYYNSANARSLFSAANYFGDPYLKWSALRQNLKFTPQEPRGNQSLNPVEFLIYNNPNLESKPVSELPLTKYFPSPKGAMIARTGWNEGIDSPDMVVEMKINEVWFANHQHLDAGAFQIYYKGALATDTGYYKSGSIKPNGTENNGSSDYGSVHWKNYARRTIGHNCITVFDPGEKWPTDYENDGGQQLSNGGKEASTLDILLDPANEYRSGTVLGHEYGSDPYAPNYTYLKGDLAEAYSKKMENYERSFMFLNLKDKDHPGAMIVFDRVVSSNPVFKKSWLLHGLHEPEINGTQTVLKDTRTGYNGKLTVDTLLPKADNVAIEKIGGADKEYWVNGTNFFAVTKQGGINEAGGWRIEVSPKAPSKTDYFLNVLQVGDANPDMQPLPVTSIETDRVAGVVIADRVVVFGKDRDRTKENVEFSFAGDGEFEVTVADLVKGTWSIMKDGSQITTVFATEEGGVAVFHGSAGSYQLTYQNEIVNRSTIAPQIPYREDIGIRIDNTLIYTDVPPTVQNGRTLVPMRAIFEKLNVSVTWDEVTATATATKGDRVVKITQGSNIAYINGEQVTLDVPADVITGRFLVPVRFVSEAFGATVEWLEFSKVVNITSK